MATSVCLLLIVSGALANLSLPSSNLTENPNAGIIDLPLSEKRQTENLVAVGIGMDITSGAVDTTASSIHEDIKRPIVKCSDFKLSCSGLSKTGKCSSMLPGLCSCDISCILYGDCCLDFNDLCLAAYNVTSLVEVVKRNYLRVPGDNYGIQTLRSYFIRHSKCYSFKVSEGDTHFRMIGSCPEGYSGEALIKCEKQSILFPPVSVTFVPEITFINKYCAQCNGYELDKTTPWNITASCPSNFSKKDYSTIMESIERECTFEVGFDNLPKVRRCFSKYKMCENSHRTDGVLNMSDAELKCRSYLYPLVVNHETVLKNQYCAICLGYTDDELKCPDKSSESQLQAGSGIGSITVLFNFDTSDVVSFDIDKKNIRQCRDTETFIPVTGECKEINCPSGEEFVNGSCKPTFQQNHIHRDDQVFANASGKYYVTFFLMDSESNIVDTHDEECNDKKRRKEHSCAMYFWLTKLSNILQANDQLQIDFTSMNNFEEGADCLTTSKVDYDELVDNCVQSMVRPAHKINHILNNTLSKINSLILNTTHTLTVAFVVNDFPRFRENAWELIESLTEVKTDIRFVTKLSNIDDLLLKCPNSGEIRVLSNLTLPDHHVDGESFITLDNISYYSFRHLPYEEIALPSSLNQTWNTVVICRPLNILLDCLFVIFDHEQYTITNETIRINEMEMRVEEDEYSVDNGSLYICLSALSDGKQWTAFFTPSETERIISNVFLGISMFSLLITIAVYSLIPSLRTVPGKCVMALSLTLLLAQAGLFFTNIDHYKVCFAVAVSLHYLWLSSFSWMAIISFDFNHTFGSYNITASNNRKIKVYYLLSWGVPALFVGGSVIVDKFKPGGFHVGYGQGGLCWITVPLASVYMFGLPVLVILLANMGCILRIVIAIERATKQSASVLNKKADKRRLLTYAKISSVMGMTWIFGFVSAFTGEVVIRYMYLVFNSLQGLFIALSFALNGRVLRELRKKSKYMSESNNLSRTTSNTLT